MPERYENTTDTQIEEDTAIILLTFNTSMINTNKLINRSQ